MLRIRSKVEAVWDNVAMKLINGVQEDERS